MIPLLSLGSQFNDATRAIPMVMLAKYSAIARRNRSFAKAQAAGLGHEIV